MNSFVDTNVSIAFIFSIDPLNNKSMSVFREYDDIYWSKLVKSECKDVFKSKRKILVNFYKDLANDLKPEDFHDFEFNDLKKYVLRNYPKGKRRDQILSSLQKFWDNYVNERVPTYNSFIQAVQICLNDLKNLVYSRKSQWEQNTLLTDARVKKYINLKKKLNSLKVHPPDDRQPPGQVNPFAAGAEAEPVARLGIQDPRLSLHGHRAPVWGGGQAFRRIPARRR